MASGAALLSLHISRFLQGGAEPPRSSARWRLLPDLTDLTFPTASEAVDAMQKPVILAPLASCGAISVTPLSLLDARTEAQWRFHHRNQNDNIAPYLTRFGAKEGDTLAIGSADGTGSRGRDSCELYSS